MLRFESQYMRECINDGSDQVMMQYCSLCLYELNRVNKRVQQRNYQNVVQINGQNVQPWFILRTISQLSALFKNKTQSPILKFKATKLLTYLILINEPQIYHKFQLQLYPLIKNICLYNKSQPVLQRGLDYFKNNKYYELGNVQEKQKIKQIGVKFLIYCLQLVLVMNKWWRVDEIDRMEITPYGKGYDALLKQGVKFMEEEDMIFWGESKISQIIKNINKCTAMVSEKGFSIQSTGLYKHNINNVSNLSNTSVSASYTENPSRLNKQMQQKDDVINQLKVEIDKVRREKQALMGEFSRQRQQWENRVQQCERKLRQMKGVVRILKKKLNKYQNNNNNIKNTNKDKLYTENNEQEEDYESMLFSTQQSQPSFICQMRQSIKLLISQNLKLQQQNKQLKTQLQSLQQKVQKQLRVKKNIDINERRQLIEQVLKNQCKQKREIQGSSSLRSNKANLNRNRQLFKSNEFVFVKQSPRNYNRLNKAKSVQNINVQPFNRQKQPFNTQKQPFNTQQQHIDTQKANNRQTIIPYPFESAYYRCLSSQVRTRLKRCLLKQKQILSRDQDIQIGVRHSIKDEISFNMQIVITNITNTHQMQSSLNKLALEIVTKNAQSQITIKEKSMVDGRYRNINDELDNKKRDGIQQILFSKQSLTINTQWRIQLIVVINDINFRQLVLMTLKYKKQSIKKQKNSQSRMKTIGLILPISKFKLLNLLPCNKISQLNRIKNKANTCNESNKITKLFELNTKVLTSLNKLITYFGQQYTQVIKRSNTNKQKVKVNQNDKRVIQQQIEQIVVNFEYLSKKISLAFRPIKENKNKSTNQTYSIDNENSQSIQMKQQTSDYNKNVIKRRQSSLIMLTVSSIEQSNQLILQSIADQFLFILSRN